LVSIQNNDVKKQKKKNPKYQCELLNLSIFVFFFFVFLLYYLYLPGQLSDVRKVIVDVGTGYYVEKVLLINFSLFRDESICYFLIAFK